MSWVDILIIAVAIIGAYIGWKQGLIRTLFTIVGLIVGVALAGLWSPGFAEVISPSGAQWAYFLAFAIILIIVLIIASIIGKILRTFLKVLMLGYIDSLGGIALGVIFGALVMAALLTSMGPYVNEIPGGYDSSLVEAIGDSALAELLIDNFGLLLGLLPGEFDAVKDFFN